MMNIHSKYDNKYKNGMFYAFICISDHVIISIICMLSVILQNCAISRQQIFREDKEKIQYIGLNIGHGI